MEAAAAPTPAARGAPVMIETPGSGRMMEERAPATQAEVLAVRMGARDVGEEAEAVTAKAFVFVLRSAEASQMATWMTAGRPAGLVAAAEALMAATEAAAAAGG